MPHLNIMVLSILFILVTLACLSSWITDVPYSTESLYRLLSFVHLFSPRILLPPCPSCFSFISVQFSSITQSYPTLCEPMNRSTPGLPVHHHLLEFTQTHIHRVGDAIQPSHPLSSPSPPVPNPSQNQSLF